MKILLTAHNIMWPKPALATDQQWPQMARAATTMRGDEMPKVGH